MPGMKNKTLTIHVGMSQGGILCCVCDRIFKNNKLVELHERVSHGIHPNKNIKEVYCCSHCDLIFSSKKEFRKHVKRIQGDLK